MQKDSSLLDLPVFIISIDTELIWGNIAFPAADMVYLMRNDKEKVRGCINILLNLLRKHNIPATWAVVGHLFLDNCICEDGIPHKNISKINEYWYSSDPCTDIQKDPLYYGRDIIEKILSSRIKHEIGYHSFSHVDFTDCNLEVAEAEIKIGIKLAKKFNITLKSFVFPENKINYVDILKKYGFEIYRGINLRTKNINKNILARILYFATSEIIASPVEPVNRNGIWEIQSSMTFSDRLFPYSLVLRSKLGIYRAIRDKKIFHIYLHPGTLLSEPSLEKKLDKLLAFIANKRDEGKIEVMTMGDLAEILNKRQIY